MPDLTQLLVVLVKAGEFFSHSKGFKRNAINFTVSKQSAQGLHKGSCAGSFRHASEFPTGHHSWHEVDQGVNNSKTTQFRKGTRQRHQRQRHQQQPADQPEQPPSGTP